MLVAHAGDLLFNKYPDKPHDGLQRTVNWSFGGAAVTADRIMQRAGLDSAKPSDLFKIKAPSSTAAEKARTRGNLHRQDR